MKTFFLNSPIVLSLFLGAAASWGDNADTVPSHISAGTPSFINGFASDTRFPSNSIILHRAVGLERNQIEKLAKLPDFLELRIQRDDPPVKLAAGKYPEVSNVNRVGYYEADIFRSGTSGVSICSISKPMVASTFVQFVNDLVVSNCFVLDSENQTIKLKSRNIIDSPEVLRVEFLGVKTGFDDTGGKPTISEVRIHFELKRNSGDIRVFTWSSTGYIEVD